MSHVTSFENVLKLMSLKRNFISQTVFMFNLAWKDLEEHFDYLEKTFEEAILEFQVREIVLNSSSKSVAESKEQVELLRKSVELRCEELDRREAEFDFSQQDRIEYFREREEQMENRFADIKRRAEERIDDADFKEERLEPRVNLMASELEYVQLQLHKRFEDLHVKEQQLLQREKQAEALMIKYRKQSNALKLKKKVLLDRSKELDATQRRLERQTNSEIKMLQLKQEEFDNKSKEIVQIRELLEQQVREVEVERKHIHERMMDIESKEIKKHDDANVFVKCDPSVDIHMSIVTRILANMDGRYLLQFLSKHTMEFDLMQDNVSNALKMSYDSGRIVIVAIMEEFHCQNITSNSMMSFLFVLEILAGNIPTEIIKSPVVTEVAIKVAVEWKANLSWKKDPMYILGFLQLVCTYKLTSEFDGEELYNLCCIVADDCDGHVPELSEILSSSEKVPVSKILNIFQDKMDQQKKAHWDSLPRGTVPDLFLLSSNPASLLLDAMQCCFDSTMKGTMDVFLPLLKEIVNVDAEIDIHNIQAEAFNLAVDWKPKLLFPNTTEVLCFMLFLAFYKLGSWFDHEDLFCLLIDCKSDFSGYLLLNFGLEQRLLEFIQNLIAKGKPLNAIRCIYEFDLVDKFPPVPLLKNYLGSETAVAREIYYRDNTTAEAMANAVEKELIAVQAVIKCIVNHGLELFYPLEPLRKRVIELLQEKDGGKKRHAPFPDSNLEAHSVKKGYNRFASTM